MYQSATPQLAVLSINHHHAPLAIREQLNRAESRIHAALHQAMQEPAIPFVAYVVVCTCNRTEIYVDSTDLSATKVWLTNLISTFIEGQHTQLSLYAVYLQLHEAEYYIYRVACGLESLVLGEPQIIGQLKRALRDATCRGNCSAYLRQLFMSAIRAGRAAQQHTHIGRYSTSVAHVAVTAMQHTLGETPPRVMLWGAGEIAQLVAQALQHQHIPFAICNRSATRAHTLATKYMVPAIAWEQRLLALADYNVLIVATHAPTYVLRQTEYHTPLRLIIDLSVPRNVDPHIAHCIPLIDIDTLHQVVDHHKAQRLAAKPAVETLIQQHYHAFIEWKQLKRVTATITTLRQHAAQICEAETQHAQHLLDHTHRTAHDVITQLGHRITHKLLHTPTMQIRQHAIIRAQEEYYTFMATTHPLHIRIGTRGSALARWQSDFVAQSLTRMYPQLTTTTTIITTKGDIDIQSPLPLIGGKGLFTAEIEQQLHAHTIDIAVHSLKDLPTETTAGLPIVAIPVRGDHADVLISRHDYTLHTLPLGARVGTSSIRRAAQLLHLRPDLRMVDIRGNINSRLQKAMDPLHALDAIVLAQAGLTRLNLHKYISYVFSNDEMLCAPGQGALAVQSHQDPTIMTCLQAIHDIPTAIMVTLERGILTHLGGGCSAPIAAYAYRTHNDTYRITARVLSRDGQTCIHTTATHQVHDVDQAFLISAGIAEQLRQRGASQLLAGGSADEPQR
jgi:hydroxymethylbilane synthase